MSKRPELGAPGSLTSVAFDAGVIWHRQEVTRYLIQRAIDLRLCTKNDNCHEIADVLDGCIDDIKTNNLAEGKEE